MFRLFVLFLLFLPYSQAWSHFSEGLQIRELVLTQQNETTFLYIRSPLPLLFGADATPSDRAQMQSSFLYLEKTPTDDQYRLSLQMLKKKSGRFKEKLEGALLVFHNGSAIKPNLLSFVISPRLPISKFNSAESAIAALNQPSTRDDPVFGDGFVDYVLQLPALKDITSGIVSVQAAHPIPLQREGVSIETHLTIDNNGTTHTSIILDNWRRPLTFLNRSYLL